MVLVSRIRNRLIRENKWLQRYVRYRKWRWNRGDRTPWAASLKITWRCNLACTQCFWRKKFTSDDLPKEKWFSIIDGLARKGCVEVVIEGGEPALREDFPDIVRYASKRMLRVDVVTNGTIPFDPMELHRLYISIDGLGETHDTLRGNGTFDRVEEFIDTYERKDQLVLLVSVWRGNVDTLNSLFEHFQNRVSGFWISFLYDTGEGELALDRDERRRVGRKLLKLKNKGYPILNSDAYLLSLGNGKSCHKWVLATVLADGTMAPTCYPFMFGAHSCEGCDLACYKEVDSFLYPEDYSQPGLES